MIQRFMKRLTRHGGVYGALGGFYLWKAVEAPEYWVVVVLYGLLAWR